MNMQQTESFLLVTQFWRRALAEGKRAKAWEIRRLAIRMADAHIAANACQGFKARTVRPSHFVDEAT